MMDYVDEELPAELLLPFERGWKQGFDIYLRRFRRLALLAATNLVVIASIFYISFAVTLVLWLLFATVLGAIALLIFRAALSFIDGRTSLSW
jgi:hypothetical protein